MKVWRGIREDYARKAGAEVLFVFTDFFWLVFPDGSLKNVFGTVLQCLLPGTCRTGYSRERSVCYVEKKKTCTHFAP